MTTARIIQQPISVFSRTRKGLGRWLPVAIIGVFVIAAVFAPYVAPYDPNAQNLLARLNAPGTV